MLQPFKAFLPSADTSQLLGYAVSGLRPFGTMRKKRERKAERKEEKAGEGKVGERILSLDFF